MTANEFSEVVRVVSIMLFVIVVVASFLGRLVGDLVARGVVLFLLRRIPAWRRFERADRIACRRALLRVPLIRLVLTRDQAEWVLLALDVVDRNAIFDRAGFVAAEQVVVERCAEQGVRL